MPTTGKCTNIGNCDKADRKELITIPDGGDLICPDCDKPLLMVPGSGGGGMGKIAAVALVLLLIAGWFLWPQSELPTTSTSTPPRPPVEESDPPPPPAQSRNIILSIHGSNTIGSKLAPALAKAFLEAKGASRVEQVPGKKEQESVIQGDLNGDTVPEAIEIHAHGSKTGFAGLKSGACDIGMSSSRIRTDTVNDLLPLLGDLTSNASEHTVALDGLAVIVHPANPVSALTVEQVAAIFAGEKTDWSQVGGAPAPIALYARDDKSGTFEFFKTNVLERYKRTLSPAARRFEDSGELSSGVAGDVNGIGFIGMPYIKTNKALALSDRGTQPLRPNERTVKTEDYPLTRRLYLYTPASPKNNYTTEFISFATNHASGSAARAAVNAAAFVNLDPTPVAGGERDRNNARNVSAEWRRLTAGASEFLTRFRFRVGRSELDTRAHRDIGRIVGLLSQSEYENARLLLIGFADSSGSSAANRELSLQRARVVEGELRTEGLRIEQVVGLGAEAPVASNDDADGRERNRRVEIWVKR